jgi:hypothetical protein
MKATLPIALLFAVTSKAAAAPDYTERLFIPEQEHTAPIMTSHISGKYRFDLLSPMIMTDYGSKAFEMPYMGEAYHGVFMVVTDRNDNVVFFRSDMTQKEFLFKENLSTQELTKLREYLSRNNLDENDVDLMVVLRSGSWSDQTCHQTHTLFFKTNEQFKLLDQACGDSPSAWKKPNRN